MHNLKYKSMFDWVRIFTIVLLIALLLPANSVLARTPAQTSDPFTKRAPVNGFHDQKPSAIPNFSPARTSAPSISPTGSFPSISTGNLIQDPSFESSYGTNFYWDQYSYQFGTPLCYPDRCGYGGGTAGPRSGSFWVWFGGVPATYDEVALVQQIVTIPVCTSNPKLQFYLWIGYAGPGSGADDKFYVSVDSGSPLFVANATQKNQYPGYTLVTVNMSAYADGSPHGVQFFGETFGQTVNFNLDDVSLTGDFSNCIISGNAGTAGVTLSYTDGTAKTATSLGNASYSLPVTYGWSGSVTPSHPCYTFSPTSIPYNNVTTNLSNQNYTALFNAASGCANINVEIGGNPMGNYGLLSGQTVVPFYEGVAGGAVEVESTNGMPIFTSEHRNYQTSFSETLGYPDNQLTTKYWFTRYAYNANVKTWILIANPDASQTAEVEVYIGSNLTPIASYLIAPGQSITLFYDGVANGPVMVESTNGVPIFTSEHRNYQTSFSESLGFPDNQLTTKYWFTRYAYNANVKTWILVVNPDPSQTAEVSIHIGDLVNPHDSFTVGPGTSVVKYYDGVANGPVMVESTNGVEIFTSEHRNYQTSFSESLGFPDNQLTTRYWFTRYAYNANVKTWILVVNPDPSQTAEVSVYIGNSGIPVESFSLAAGASVSKFYNGVAGGPVLVESTNGVEIFTSEHRNYQTSFSESLGFPDNQLTTKYWFTRYAYNANVKTWILIAKPE